MEKKDQQIHFLATAGEVERIREKMNEMGIQNRAAYLRKMALDGYCVRLDLQEIKEMIVLLRRCSNNLNQYARNANETGRIYEADIQDLKERLDAIWQCARSILVKLSAI